MVEAKIFRVIFAVALLAACTQRSSLKLTSGEYAEQGKVMLGVTQKLASDTDAKRMHNAALNIEKSRIVSCIGVFDECRQYGEFLATAIRYSSDGALSYKEISDLKRRHKDLREQIFNGLKHLREQQHQTTN